MLAQASKGLVAATVGQLQVERRADIDLVELILRQSQLQKGEEGDTQ